MLKLFTGHLVTQECVRLTPYDSCQYNAKEGKQQHLDIAQLTGQQLLSEVFMLHILMQPSVPITDDRWLYQFILLTSVTDPTTELPL